MVPCADLEQLLLNSRGCDAAGDALHEDVRDVHQDGTRGQQHQNGKQEGADGVSQLPGRAVLLNQHTRHIQKFAKGKIHDQGDMI